MALVGAADNDDNTGLGVDRAAGAVTRSLPVS